MSRIAALSPGVALAAVVAVIAFPVARLTGSGLGFDRSPISPVLVGVLMHPCDGAG